MTSFQLVFQGGNGTRHREYHRSSFENEPHIDGRPAVDGATYLINGVEWIVRREDIGDSRGSCAAMSSTQPNRDTLGLDGTNRKRATARGDARRRRARGETQRAVANKNTIVGLSLDDRRRITAVLAEDAPWGLAQLQSVLVKQLKQHKDREAQDLQVRLNRERALRQREPLE